MSLVSRRVWVRGRWAEKWFTNGLMTLTDRPTIGHRSMMNRIIPRCRVASRAAALVTVMVFILIAPAAHADQAPGFTAGPAIDGRPTMGAQLRIAASWNGVPSPGWIYEWQR